MDCPSKFIINCAEEAIVAIVRDVLLKKGFSIKNDTNQGGDGQHEMFNFENNSFLFWSFNTGGVVRFYLQVLIAQRHQILYTQSFSPEVVREAVKGFNVNKNATTNQMGWIVVNTSIVTRLSGSLEEMVPRIDEIRQQVERELLNGAVESSSNQPSTSSKRKRSPSTSPASLISLESGVDQGTQTSPQSPASGRTSLHTPASVIANFGAQGGYAWSSSTGDGSTNASPDWAGQKSRYDRTLGKM